MDFDTRALRMPVLLVLLIPVGCATEHLQTEKALAVVGFKQHRGTPEVENYLRDAQPYVFISYKDNKLGQRFFFVSPARKTVFEGDKTTMQYFQIFQQQEAQRAALDKGQSRTRWVQLGQALAPGGAMGAAQAGQNTQQQAALQQYSLMTQPPPMVDVASAFPQTTTFSPDGLGGFQGSDGSTVQPDGLGGYRVRGGY